MYGPLFKCLLPWITHTSHLRCFLALRKIPFKCKGFLFEGTPCGFGWGCLFTWMGIQPPRWTLSLLENSCLLFLGLLGYGSVTGAFEIHLQVNTCDSLQAEDQPGTSQLCPAHRGPQAHLWLRNVCHHHRLSAAKHFSAAWPKSKSLCHQFHTGQERLLGSCPDGLIDNLLFRQN